MDNQPLTRQLIADTSYHQLALRTGPGSLDLMIYNPMEENSLIVRHFGIPTDSEERLKAIETVIYDNPLLLGEFQKVRVAVDTDRFLIVPSGVTDPADRLTLFKAAHPDLDGSPQLIAETYEGLGTTFLTAIPAPEANFIRRTFNNPPISNSLATFMRYCHSLLSKGHSIKAFANINQGWADIVVASHTQLFLANRFAYRDPADLAYYIMAATDPANGREVAEILLTGDKPTREELTKTLRRFRPYVMPMIFPSAMYRAGGVAMKAPFDLIILPLCE